MSMGCKFLWSYIVLFAALSFRGAAEEPTEISRKRPSLTETQLRDYLLAYEKVLEEFSNAHQPKLAIESVDGHSEFKMNQALGLLARGWKGISKDSAVLGEIKEVYQDGYQEEQFDYLDSIAVCRFADNIL